MAWCCVTGVRERALRTFVACLTLNAYAAAFLAGHDFGPAAVHVRQGLVDKAIMCLGIMAIVMHVADVERWFEFGVAAMLVVVLFAVAQSQEGQPALLSAIALLGLPMLARVLQRTVLAGRLVTDVLGLVAFNCFLISGWSLVLWLLWVGGGHDYRSNQRHWRETIGCRHSSDSMCRQHAFILWGSGAILSGFSGLLGVAAGLLSHSTMRVPRWVVAKLGLAAIRAGAPGATPTEASIARRSAEPPALNNRPSFVLDLTDKESMLQTAQLLIAKQFERSDHSAEGAPAPAETEGGGGGCGGGASGCGGGASGCGGGGDGASGCGAGGGGGPLGGGSMAGGASSSIGIGTIAKVAYTAAELQERADRMKKDAASASTVFSAVVAGLGLCVWVATAVAGAEMRLSHAFTAFFVSAILGVALLVGAAIGYGQLVGRVSDRISPLARVFLAWVDGEYASACAVVFAAPLFAGYLLLALIHQSVRRCRAALGCPSHLGPGRGGARLAGSGADAGGEDRGGEDSNGDGRGDGRSDDDSQAPPAMLTRLATRQIETLRGWAWASILLKAYTVGLVAWMLLYGSTLTYMGLALLISWLQSMHWLVASCVFFALGLVLFLLPPVPGLAVYLTAGVLITPSAESAFGYWPACAYAALLAVGIKLVAQVLQMKLIGERLGRSTSVKAAVGVNTDLIKAIRHILSQPGLSMAKVCILCAGPDWPTAVLCGILRLDVMQMLLGLLPVLFLTAPTTLAASFQLRISEGGVWEPLAALMLLLATLVQLAAGMVALYYIEQVKNNQSIVFEPNDEEVDAVERREALAHRAYASATQLSNLPMMIKAVLFSGALVLITSVHMLVFFIDACFESFALTDDVSASLCLRCERAAVKPLGWVAFAMLFYAVVCLVCFNWWAERHVASSLGAVSIADAPSNVEDGLRPNGMATVSSGGGNSTAAAGGGSRSSPMQSLASPRTDDALRVRLVLGTMTPNLYASSAREAGVSSRTITTNLRAATVPPSHHHQPSSSTHKAGYTSGLEA